MAALALVCVLLGLGATWLVPAFDSITNRAFGVAGGTALVAGSGFLLTPGSVGAGSVSTSVMAVLLVVLGSVPFALWFRRSRQYEVQTGPAWDCGQAGLTAENEYTATAFSKPLRMIFAALFRPRREIQAEFEVSPYYPSAIHFESEIEHTFEIHFYGPLRDGILALAARVRRLQTGSIHAYLAYIFVTLILLLLFAVRE
jgi:hydrogenase-4 component B